MASRILQLINRKKNEVRKKFKKTCNKELLNCAEDFCCNSCIPHSF